MGIKRKGARARKEARRKVRQQDIRVSIRRAALRAARQGNQEPAMNSDTTPSHILLNDYNTAPIQATKRLQRLNTSRVLKARQKKKHRWIPTLDQEYFGLNRKHSYQILQRVTGKGLTHWRTIRAGTYNRLQNMEWLEEAAEYEEQGEQVEGASLTKTSTVERNFVVCNDSSNQAKDNRLPVCMSQLSKIASSRLGIG